MKSDCFFSVSHLRSSCSPGRSKGSQPASQTEPNSVQNREKTDGCHTKMNDGFHAKHDGFHPHRRRLGGMHRAISAWLIDHVSSDHVSSDHISSDHVSSDHISSDHISSDHVSSDSKCTRPSITPRQEDLQPQAISQISLEIKL